MTYMWSKNKYIEYAINIMLVLLGMNFMHYGQLFLIPIALLILLDNKLKIKVNSLFTFIVLILFGITFFIFTFKWLGFYSVMGVTLPLTYYIGSNINLENDNLRKLIYIISISLASYLVINFGYELYLYRDRIALWFAKVRVVDVWTGTKQYPTSFTMHALMFVGIICDILFFNKNNKIKYLSIFILMAIFVYNIKLARRLIILEFIIGLVIWVLLDITYVNKRKIKFNNRIVLISCTFLLALLAIYMFNILGIRSFFEASSLYRKIVGGLSSGRFETFIEFLKLMPKYLWGGQLISSKIGLPIHDLWSDTYDCAGIICWALLIVYSINVLKSLVKFFNLSNIDKNDKRLIVMLLSAIALGLMMEPVMTGQTIFLICSISCLTVLEKNTLLNK